MTTPSTPRPWLASIFETEAILAIGSLIIFAAALFVVLFQIVPAANEKYAMLILGALIGVVKDTFGRYFQSTKGAQEQRKDFADLAITAAAAGANPPPPAPGTAQVNAGADVDVSVTRTPAASDDFEIPPAPSPRTAADARSDFARKYGAGDPAAPEEPGVQLGSERPTE